MRTVCFFGRWLWPMSEWLQRAFVVNGWTIARVMYVVSQIIMVGALIQFSTTLLVVLGVNAIIDYPVFSLVKHWAETDQELGKFEATVLVDHKYSADSAFYALAGALLCAPIVLAHDLGQIVYLVATLTSWALRCVAYVWVYGPQLPPEDRTL